MNSPESRKAQENSLNQEDLEKKLVSIQEIMKKWEDACLYVDDADDEDETSRDEAAPRLEKEIEEIINNIIEAINRFPKRTISRVAHDKLKKIEQQLQEIQNQVLTDTETRNRAKTGIRKIMDVTEKLKDKIKTSASEEEETYKIHHDKPRSDEMTKEQLSAALTNGEIEPNPDLLGKYPEEASIAAEPDPALSSRDSSPNRETSVESSEKGTLPNQGVRIATADGASVAKEILEQDTDNDNERADPNVALAESDESEFPRPENVALPPIKLDLSRYFPQDTPPDFGSSRHGAVSEVTYEKPHAIAPKPSRPKSFLSRVRNLAQAAALGIAAFLGLSHPPEEKAPEAREQDRVTDTAETNEGNYQEMPPVTLATEEKITEESKSLTETYTLKPGDSFWRIAEGIIKNAGGNANDTTAVLEIVHELKKENPEVAKRTWAGAMLDTASANELARIQANELRGTYEESLTEETGAYFPITPETSDNVHNKKSQPSQEEPSHENAEVTADTLEQEEMPDTQATSSDDKLTHPYLQRGETIWSRTHDMLLTLDMKPNMAKRGVLGAIILKDSGINETQAMRIKAEGSKNFDKEKHRLHFERAKQAAEDLQCGMSPAEVAKKYGVKDVYKKYSER